MVYHAILGLLRDGRPRHGYDMILEYRGRCGRPVNPGNFYRECSKLAAQGLITPDANPPDADPRRIPYRITHAGCRDFDTWLLEPKPLQAALDNWMVFADMLPATERVRLLDEMRETLWMEGKALGSAREQAIARARRLHDGPSYRSSAFLMLRRIKQITAELEFLQELRRELEQAPPSGVNVSGRSPEDSASTDGARRSPVTSPRAGRKG